YVLMNPVLIGAMWAGGISADLVFVAFNAGLVGPPSPGSIFAYLGLLPTEGTAILGVLLGVAVGAAASFIVGSILLRLFPVKEMKDTDTDVELGDVIPAIPGLAIPGATR
ncbi:MAG TPA: PTS mannitol transporter subunit IIBC, partial [Acidimicrobiia bacterium]|nr:PTS mannitol transporter subunit IIBC [Acidimicrobiia bacterium]